MKSTKPMNDMPYGGAERQALHHRAMKLIYAGEELAELKALLVARTARVVEAEKHLKETQKKLAAEIVCRNGWWDESKRLDAEIIEYQKEINRLSKQQPQTS